MLSFFAVTFAFLAVDDSMFVTHEEAEILHRYSHRNWYTDKLSGGVSLSFDQRFLTYINEGDFLLHDLFEEETVSLSPRVGFESVALHNWLPGGELLDLKGYVDGQLVRQLYDFETGELRDSPIPRNFLQGIVAAEGGVIAGIDVRAEGRGLYHEDLESGVVTPILKGRTRLNAMALSADGARFAYLRLNDSGWSDLWLFEIASETKSIIASNLDTSYQKTTMAFSPDGQEIYASLVGIEKGEPQDKHRPDSDRDLDIFAFNLENESWRVVLSMPGDDLVTAVTDDALIWTNLQSCMQTAMVPLEGGEPSILSGRQTSYPYWHPDGETLSVMIGEWHLADWALNWDIATLRVDKTSGESTEPSIFLEGFHEDFNLAWSPDAKWVAYHSHRSEKPVASYGAVGSTDDIWMRRADGGEEWRLSNGRHLETLQAEWSSDSRRLVFCSIDTEGRYRANIITIDPQSGQGIDEHIFKVDGIGDVIGANWSPDGSELYLEEQVDHSGRRLWRVSVDGTSKELLQEYRSLVAFGGLDVTSDGETIVYFALADDGHHQLFRISKDGSERHQLTHGDREFITPQISPDDRFVAGSYYAHLKQVLSIPLE